MQEKNQIQIIIMEILYSGCGPIACYRLRHQPSELCARGTTPESLWRLCAAPDRPSQRPTAGLGPRPVHDNLMGV